MNGAIEGRAAFLEWETHKPKNFFSADDNLQNVLRRYLTERFFAFEDKLTRVGTACATVLDEAAKIEDRIGNHPRLDRWTGMGTRAEQIEFHPNHDLIGATVWQSEIMAMQAVAGNTVPQMALFYLFSHNGECGHLCSLACTSGLIRALQQVAAEDVKVKFLPPLLNPDYASMQHAAQFLTEVQGGSDVGLNAVTARPCGDGTWRISGEKWFCSNINSHQFLMTARPENGAAGTAGLGLFLVPRQLDTGETNHFFIRRLKDKLGTRTLASAEVDFVDAVAYPVGALESGFKNVVEYVLNTSRLMNAVACAGIMRRATLEAATYAAHRRAFGNPIAVYPLVQEAIADLLTETAAATASSFYLAYLLDRIETGYADEKDGAVYRLLVNANKYITSIRGSEMIHRAIEVLGGNGAIESFSILPRLYRDMVVLESWEGAHNVLCLQILRDIQRFGLLKAYTATMHTLLNGVKNHQLVECATFVGKAVDQTLVHAVKLHQGGDRFAQAHARRFVDHLAHSAQATLLLAEAQWEMENNLPSNKHDMLVYFIQRRLNRHYDPLEDHDYLSRLERLNQPTF